MKPITIKQFENQLKHNYGSTFLVELEGIITTKIEIENVEIKIEENNIIIYDQKDKTKKVLLNIHQIMKIEKVINENYNIKFDSIQNVKIIVENEK